MSERLLVFLYHGFVVRESTMVSNQIKAFSYPKSYKEKHEQVFNQRMNVKFEIFMTLLNFFH